MWLSRSTPSVYRIAPPLPSLPSLPAGMPRLATGGAAATPPGGKGTPPPSPLSGSLVLLVPLAPDLGAQGPALVVAPAVADLEVARRETLEHEAAALDQRDRRQVAGLDVGLEAMQAQVQEGVPQQQLHALGHVALASVGSADVIAEISALQRAAHDLAEAEDAEDGAAAGAAGEQRQRVRAPRSRQEHLEGDAVQRRRHPGMVQATAGAHQRHQLRLVARRRLSQVDAAPAHALRGTARGSQRRSDVPARTSRTSRWPWARTSHRSLERDTNPRPCPRGPWSGWRAPSGRGTAGCIRNAASRSASPSPRARPRRRRPGRPARWERSRRRRRRRSGAGSRSR